MHARLPAMREGVDMLELKIKTGRKHIPIFDLPAALGRKEASREIATPT